MMTRNASLTSHLPGKLVALFILMAAYGAAQTPGLSVRPDPAQLVRAAVDNEIKTSQDENARFMFRSTRTTPRGSVTKVFVQAKEATAGIVVAYNGKPLTPEQRQDELNRIERFIKTPDELEKKRRQERVDADRSLRIIRALPDAFLYEYDGTQMGSPGVGKTGDSLVALKFRPNPHYDPPSRVEQVLTGMEGVLLLDASRKRLASIDGTLAKDVGFGWGILGHLDKGGHVLVQQQEVGGRSWTISRTNVDVTGKILLFKSLAFSMSEVFSDFKPIPHDTTFAQAVEILEKEQSELADSADSGKLGAAVR